jgi:hypothetical protein
MLKGTQSVDALNKMIEDAEKGQQRKRDERRQRRLIASKPVTVKVKDSLSSARLEALHALFKKARTLKSSYTANATTKYDRYKIGDLERSVMRCPEFGRAERLCGRNAAVERMHEAII